MKSQRQQQIIALLEENNIVNTVELAERFHVSIETIRRDLNQLEILGVLQKTYGGAKLQNKLPTVLAPVEKRMAENSAAKTAIGAAVAQYIRDGEVVACDSGSTLLYAARFLNEKKNMIYLVNDIMLARNLLESEANRVFMLGGFLSSDGSATGSYARDFLNSISHIDYFLVSCDGANLIDGLSMFEEEILLLKKRLIKKASQRIALIDHSKFSKRAFNKLCDFNELDMVVTDSGTPPKTIEQLRSAGIQVLVAEL